MDVFPAFFPLAGRRIVIVGAGEAAEAKARLFEGSPAVVTRVVGDDALKPETYAGAALVFIAGGDEVFLSAAASAARAAGIPVNVVDHPTLCDFTTPAVVDRGEVVAAVGTTGAAPMLAALLRNDLEAAIPEGVGRVATLFRLLRDDIRTALPDLARRRAFLRDHLSGPIADAAATGDMTSAADGLRRALAADPSAPRAGRVLIVNGTGPSDLLSLRASRALSLAETLIADPGCSLGILGLGRRDAHRLSPDEAGAPEMIAMARDGQQIVRLVTSPVDPLTIRALEAAGITIETLKSAPA